MENLHDLAHLLHSSGAREFIGVECVQTVTVIPINLLQLPQERYTARAVEGKHLTDHEGGVYSILVPDVSASQVSVGFLKTADIVPLVLHPSNNLADELEAGQDVDGLYAIVFSDFLR